MILQGIDQRRASYFDLYSIFVCLLAHQGSRSGVDGFIGRNPIRIGVCISLGHAEELVPIGLIPDLIECVSLGKFLIHVRDDEGCQFAPCLRSAILSVYKIHWLHVCGSNRRIIRQARVSLLRVLVLRLQPAGCIGQGDHRLQIVLHGERQLIVEVCPILLGGVRHAC